MHTPGRIFLADKRHWKNCCFSVYENVLIGRGDRIIPAVIVPRQECRKFPWSLRGMRLQRQQSRAHVHRYCCKLFRVLQTYIAVQRVITFAYVLHQTGFSDGKSWHKDSFVQFKEYAGFLFCECALCRRCLEGDKASILRVSCFLWPWHSHFKLSAIFQLKRPIWIRNGCTFVCASVNSGAILIHGIISVMNRWWSPCQVAKF